MTLPTKTAVSLTEMARMLGLSRSRVYQLMGTSLPWPVYDIQTRRPVFTEDLQKLCLEVRQRNCGVDGQPILFYARSPAAMQPRKRSQPKPRRASEPASEPAPAPDQWLVDALSALGLNVNAAGAEAALRAIYPQGIAGNDQGEVIRAVFLHCRRQNSAGNVGR